MAKTKESGPLMRFVQRVADVAAVAQARYGARLEHERLELGDLPAANERPGPALPAVGRRWAAGTPQESASFDTRRPAPAASAGGSSGHEQSRRVIGDAQARPAPSKPNSPP